MKADPRSKRSQRRAHRRFLRSGSKNICQVYALKDADGRVVYVGQTRCALDRRMEFLRKAASPTGSPIERFMAKNEVRMVVLDKAAIWDVSEIVWIERMRAAGEPLLNCNLGGRDSRARVAA